MRGITLLFCLLLSWTLPASAATYYVAQQEAKAADTSAGTAEAPFKTIAAALKVLKPGDTLYIKKGVYREPILLSKDARPDMPKFGTSESFATKTTISAFPGDEVVLKGSDLLTRWALHKGPVYVAQEPFKVDLYALVFCDGKRLELLGDGGGNLEKSIVGWGGTPDIWKADRNATLADLKAGQCFYDRAAQKLYVWLPDGSDPSRHTMEVAVRGIGIYTNADYVHISGIKVYHAGIGIAGCYDLLEDSEAIDGQWDGLGVQGKYNTFLRCRFNGHGNTGIVGTGEGHRFIRCQTSYNNFLQISAGWGCGGVKLIPNLRNIVFDGHEASYNIGSPGIWFDAWNSQVTIQNSICHHNGTEGIFYEISTRGTLVNNICYENGGRGIYLSNSSDCLVFNNLLYHNGMSGVTVIGIDRRGGVYGDGPTGRLPAQNNVIWGNVFVDNCHPEFCPKDLDGREKPWDTRPELLMPEDHQINTGNVSDYNIYYRSPGRVMPFWKGFHLKGQIYDDLAAWRKIGMDEHSLVGKPLFGDEAKRDFRPAKGSCAIDFVEPRMQGIYDIEGNIRLQAGPDKKPVRFTAGPYQFEDKK